MNGAKLVEVMLACVTRRVSFAFLFLWKVRASPSAGLSSGRRAPEPTTIFYPASDGRAMVRRDQRLFEKPFDL